tara:strand:- start:1196 stop:2335 length:1140 start_codon:yes stop_codon:yes gene_type:complete
MLNTQLFGDKLKSLGYDFYSGVPCSFLKYLINYSINNCEYVGASNEGDAVAISSGAHVGGRNSVVLMQNSGLTNAISPLTSLNHTFRIPILGFVSLRGETGINDEPQHQLMGQITTSILDSMGIKWAYLSDDKNKAFNQIKDADNYIKKNTSFFFVVKKNTFDKVELNSNKNSQLGLIKKNVMIKKDNVTKAKRLEVLKVINNVTKDNVIVLATTGKTGRELYEIEDKSNNLYMVGSLGCISSLGLGLSLVRKNKKVVVIDGDGSLLMRMGNLGTIGYYHPSNLLHILLDNNTHDSTGGQETVSNNIDFTKVAEGCGYGNIFYVHNKYELEKFLIEWVKNQTLTFLYVPIEQGSKKNLGRPSIKPSEVKARLMRHLSNE